MTVAADPTFTMRDTGPAVEREVAGDLIRRGVRALPIFLAVGFVGWGVDGILSVAFAAGLILANFWVSAALMAVRHMDWVAAWPLGATLIVAHLGLLFWEARFVSASLAFPGLKPGSEE